MQHKREGKLSRRHVLLGLGALSGAGAATGTALTGSIGGTAVTGVDQAIVLDDDTAVTITGANNSVTTVSDDGTRFRAASQVTQGEQYELELLLRNRADVNLAGELLLAVDDPLQISATGGEFAQIQRVSENRFSLAVSRLANGTSGGTNVPDTVTLTVAVPADSDPGFYEMKGKIVTGKRSSGGFDETIGGELILSLTDDHMGSPTGTINEGDDIKLPAGEAAAISGNLKTRLGEQVSNEQFKLKVTRANVDSASVSFNPNADNTTGLNAESDSESANGGVIDFQTDSNEEEDGDEFTIEGEVVGSDPLITREFTVEITGN
jgi:hypothetical protein